MSSTQATNKHHNILKLLSHSQKTTKEAELIFQEIEHISFIKKFLGENVSDKTAALELCRNMSTEQFKRGDVVMAQGDPSNNKLYVILEGKAGIIINFSNSKPPESAIYDIEEEERKSNEKYKKAELEKIACEKEIKDKVVSILSVKPPVRPKQYIPFGEGNHSQDINKELRNEIQNRSSILNSSSANSAAGISNKIPFSYFIKLLVEAKRQEQESRLNGNPNQSNKSQIQQYDDEDQSQGKQNNSEKAVKNKKIQENEKKYEDQINSFGKKVNEIGQGAGFGEKALLAPNPDLAVRNATIIALNPLVCIVIQRQDFLRVLENFSKEAVFKENTITKYFQFFRHVSSNSLKERLLYYFQDIVLRKNEFLCKEGEEGEGFYILASGKVNILKSLKKKNQSGKISADMNICTIDRTTFFCEESVCTDLPFQCSIQVASQKSSFFYCSRSNFSKFPKDAFLELCSFHKSRQIFYSYLFEKSKQIWEQHNNLLKMKDYSLSERMEQSYANGSYGTIADHRQQENDQKMAQLLNEEELLKLMGEGQSTQKNLQAKKKVSIFLKNEDQKGPSKRDISGRLKHFLRLDLDDINQETGVEEINLDKTSPLQEIRSPFGSNSPRQRVTEGFEYKSTNDELDLGYMEGFRKQQHFRMVKNGMIKGLTKTQLPQLNLQPVDLKKKILRRLGKNIESYNQSPKNLDLRQRACTEHSEGSLEEYSPFSSTTPSPQLQNIHQMSLNINNLGGSSPLRMQKICSPSSFRSRMFSEKQQQFVLVTGSQTTKNCKQESSLFSQEVEKLNEEYKGKLQVNKQTTVVKEKIRKLFIGSKSQTRQLNISSEHQNYQQFSDTNNFMVKSIDQQRFSLFSPRSAKQQQATQSNSRSNQNKTAENFLSETFLKATEERQDLWFKSIPCNFNPSLGQTPTNSAKLNQTKKILFSSTGFVNAQQKIRNAKKI